MSPESQGEPVTPAVDSATVLLLREAPESSDGIEVLLLRRHGRSPAFAGAFVFPGGKVDTMDRHLDRSLWRCSDLASLREKLGVDTAEDVLGLLVTAVRETFEEAGVLLAQRRGGTRLATCDLESESFTAARAKLAAQGSRWDWSSWLARESLELDLDALVLWSWWVTPVHRPYRFDTRFFAARFPEEQQPKFDAVETTEMRWMAPSDALDAAKEGTMHLRNPTLRNLQAVARYASVAAVLESARRGNIDTRRIQPHVSWVGGEMHTTYEIGLPPQGDLPIK